MPAIINVPATFWDPVPAQPFSFAPVAWHGDVALNVAPQSWVQVFTSGLSVPVPNMLWLGEDEITVRPEGVERVDGWIPPARASWLPTWYGPSARPFDIREMAPGWAGMWDTPRVANVARLTPDVASTGNVVSLRISAGFLNPGNYRQFLNQNQLQLDPAKWDYVRFKLGGNDVTE